MGHEPPRIDANAPARGTGDPATRMRRVEERAIHEAKRFLAMFLYLFVLLSLFKLYE
jgi:hypothetical protein